MSDEYGVDIDEVFKVIDTAEVLIVRFHIIDKRLMVISYQDRRGAFIEIVQKAQSVEDHFRSMKKLRPQFAFPEK